MPSLLRAQPEKTWNLWNRQSSSAFSHRIEALASEPRPRGCRKIRGERNLWGIRIGDYRVIYAVYDDRQVVDISAVRHRSTAYR